MLERGAHRERVRVVAVVDQQDRLRERSSSSRQRRELDVEPSVGDSEAERVADDERGERVLELVARREARLAEPDRTARRRRKTPGSSTCPKRRISMSVARQIRLEQRLVGHDRRAARRQRRRSARPSPARRSSTVSTSSRCTGPTFVISADVGPRERRKPRDLAEAAHAHLE